MSLQGAPEQHAKQARRWIKIAHSAFMRLDREITQGKCRKALGTYSRARSAISAGVIEAKWSGSRKLHRAAIGIRDKL